MRFARTRIHWVCRIIVLKMLETLRRKFDKIKAERGSNQTQIALFLST